MTLSAHAGGLPSTDIRVLLFHIKECLGHNKENA